ncbi:MAG: hypothetical protein ISR65_09740 [Bacteriovoracaceae bacterium]|nr:hypothetical protein [Bacteriovoracaceae bacterium]
MKKFMLILLLVSLNTAYSYQLTCYKDINGQKLFWIADDYGSISAFNFYSDENCKINDADNSEYFVYYGEMIRSVIKCKNQKYYLTASKLYPKSDVLFGKINSLHNHHDRDDSFDIFCK